MDKVTKNLREVKSKEYRAWAAIKNRCYNERAEKFIYYGGRGITVCDRWLKSYENFLADMGRAPTQKHSIDRIEVNGNYGPENCKWSTQKEQNNNQRTNVLIEFNGQKKTLSQWCDQFDLQYKTAQARLRRGWTVEKSLLTVWHYKPYRKREKV